MSEIIVNLDLNNLEQSDSTKESSEDHREIEEKNCNVVFETPRSSTGYDTVQKIEDYLNDWSEKNDNGFHHGNMFKLPIVTEITQKQQRKSCRNLRTRQKARPLFRNMQLENSKLQILAEYSEILHGRKCINNRSQHPAVLLSTLEKLSPHNAFRGCGDVGEKSLLTASNKNINISELSSNTKINMEKIFLEENLKLNDQLAAKEAEYNNLMPRFRFLEENYQDFLLLKADYMKMKVKKMASGEYKELVDQYTQTWSTTVICEYCVDTRAKYEDPEFQKLVQLINEGECICVSKAQLQDLTNSFNILKNAIADREKEYITRHIKCNEEVNKTV